MAFIINKEVIKRNDANDKIMVFLKHTSLDTQEKVQLLESELNYFQLFTHVGVYCVLRHLVI